MRENERERAIAPNLSFILYHLGKLEKKGRTELRLYPLKDGVSSITVSLVTLGFPKKSCVRARLSPTPVVCVCMHVKELCLCDGLVI